MNHAEEWRLLLTEVLEETKRTVEKLSKILRIREEEEGKQWEDRPASMKEYATKQRLEMNKERRDRK